MVNDGMASMGNTPEYKPNMSSIQNISSTPNMPKPNMPEVKNNENIAEEPMSNAAIHPEIYFKLKPHIDMVCDLIGTYGGCMPTQSQLDQLSDGIFDDFCSMYPDMADYMHRSDPAGDPPRFRGGFRRGFRRRGVGRDLIGSLLLAELLNRGFVFF